MSQPIAPILTIASLPLADGIHVDLDPLDATHHCLLAVTAPGGEVVRVRLWVPESERGDWKRMVGMLRRR